ncbi:hypothetical protein KP003_14235 [Geomonas nitrogeniifigens]|uniref:hypothetical protein n=1 Tax=Geomonas diazotrophica TaxID=2843197 RepID=UPI001C2BED67|nr:hypothetical protein [Geomonas nitrogeniifigens]QXE85535.1 hypothetical protein KP003_14235 [Geomonas nitrogeniifigens]
MEIFVLTITLVGIGVMFRVLRLQAAFMLIGFVALAVALMPSAGKYSQYVPTSAFFGVVAIIAISLLRAVLGVLFGRRAADSFTGSILAAIFSSFIRIFTGMVRALFRVR